MMPLEQLHTVFQAIILQRLAYALPAWGPFLSVDLPPHRPLHDALTVRGHQFQLPNCTYKFHKQSFIVSSLFRFLK